MKDALTILRGDAIERLGSLPNESVQCCVTSPPYWGLRDYGEEGQLGLEKTPEEYVAKMVEVFREVRRVLRKDGTLWLNLGDSYAGSVLGYESTDRDYASRFLSNYKGASKGHKFGAPPGLKPKDLCGIPWRVAFALQADGWWLRSDIIWNKPNPMPESVTDRPTKSHEYLFLLTKSANYFYDAEAIKEGKAYSTVNDDRTNDNGHRRERGYPGAQSNGGTNLGGNDGCRNKRSVWTVATAPYPEAHFATYPPDLIKPCIMAGTSAKGCCAKCGAPWERIQEVGESDYARIKRETGRDWTDMREEAKLRGMGHDSNRAHIGGTRDANGNQFTYKAADRQTLGWQPTCKCDSGIQPCTVLDPFAGSGTTGAVALELGRKAVLIELNPKYVGLIRQRCDITMGLPLA